MTRQKQDRSQEEEVRASSRTSSRASTGGKKTNTPPVRQKSTRYTMKRLRLRTLDALQAKAMAEQQGVEFMDLSREQYQRGVQVDAALRPPGEDGKYGLYEGPRLAELVRPDIDGLISFALGQGVVPTMIQEYRKMIQGLYDTIRSLRTQGSPPSSPVPPAPPLPPGETSPRQVATEVAEEAQGVLGMFFGTEDQ